MSKQKKKHKTTAAQLTAELNSHLDSPIFTKTVCWELHRVSIHGQDSFGYQCQKSLMPAVQILGYKHCETLFSNESTFTVFPTSVGV